jgi:ribosome maturation factor RimP
MQSYGHYVKIRLTDRVDQHIRAGEGGLIEVENDSVMVKVTDTEDDGSIKITYYPISTILSIEIEKYQ